ncbi:MAG: MmgE/PrpD family protein [Candidatus Eremiobacteraeota bacterium]|nr:MmgE/PrpD family protein [Candidatus Eremiobacteraeota bacterium]
MTAAETLGEFVAGLRWDALEPKLQEKVRAHVLDTLGVMCAGVGTAEAASAQAAVRRWGGAEEATVVGRDWRVPAPQAAFLNAFHARLHTFDDTYEAGPLHPGSAIVSAALAAAESCGASGAEFLTAVLAGYETATRMSAALGPTHYGSGFHNTGTCNAFGACAAAARIYALDAGAIAEALGLAGEAAAGLRQYQEDGSMVDSSLNGARAAQTGVASVELRNAGLRGPRGIFDGRWGVCSVMSADPHLERLTEGLGATFVFSETALKPYPSCRFTHGPIHALLALQKRYGFEAGDVAEIEISTFLESMNVSDKPDIATRFDAVLSHQYNAALALMDGRITLQSFDEARRTDPALRALSARVRVVHEPELEARYPAAWPHNVAVTLRDQRRFEAVSDRPPGGCDSPLAWEDVAEKFMQLAAPELGRTPAERVVGMIGRLHQGRDIGQLSQALRSST